MNILQSWFTFPKAFLYEICYKNQQNAEENVQYNAEAFYEVVRGFPAQLGFILLNKRERSEIKKKRKKKKYEKQSTSSVPANK